MEGELAEDAVVQADIAVDGHVQDAEQEGQDLAVGGEDGIHDPHDRADARDDQEHLVGFRLLQLEIIGHRHRDEHPREDEDVESGIEGLFVHGFRRVRG